MPLQQHSEGILSIGEKTFKVASLVKAAQEDLPKKRRAQSPVYCGLEILRDPSTRKLA